MHAIFLDCPVKLVLNIIAPHAVMSYRWRIYRSSHHFAVIYSDLIHNANLIFHVQMKPQQKLSRMSRLVLNYILLNISWSSKFYVKLSEKFASERWSRIKFWHIYENNILIRLGFVTGFCRCPVVGGGEGAPKGAVQLIHIRRAGLVNQAPWAAWKPVWSKFERDIQSVAS